MKRKEAAVFLSAGIPNKDLDRWKPDVLAIREAVLALVTVVVRKKALVFGGHPAISPLVEHAAASLEAADNVIIYQSAEFEKVIPPEAKAFKNFRLTPKGATLGESLSIMRDEMLHSKEFSAGIFIGGMQGILDEFEIFNRAWPHADVIPVASTGGAARVLWKKGVGPKDERIRESLKSSKRYRALFRKLLETA
jgi:hypothetical protein